MFQASVATFIFAAFLVNPEPKNVFPLTVNLMVYSIFLNLSFGRLSRTFSDTTSKSGSASLAETKSKQRLKSFCSHSNLLQFKAALDLCGNFSKRTRITSKKIISKVQIINGECKGAQTKLVFYCTENSFYLFSKTWLELQTQFWSYK